MTMSALLKQRGSVRSFLDRPVPRETLVNIFTTAQLAPSNCNVQPWQVYVVSGAKKDELKDRLVKAVMTGMEPNPDFDWRVKYRGIHRDRQFGSANALYSSMGIDRKDKQARMLAMLRNWTFFDAPHALFLTMERYLNIMGAVDMGIYAQTLALIMEEHGISSCFQGALGQFPDPVRNFLNIPEQQGILFGMSFGYKDDTAQVNATRTDREPLENSVVFCE
ncbi:putative nitroreductase [Desulforapulum autotrophicum HRM2]|uniref:Nitroreductase n=1 Tax=Desulforapulum autotrophicum (strain ATCC 43914 / DSM 3382 / VKM B-1955 / HRM2) TaxID=177437 RepID=C0QLR9_DESAH|nr:nitroreductase [Desulforapulum autotrophicum]ACN16373.1 putative nitroreductase [Desulforapulum autotrophicum HRM2]